MKNTVNNNNNDLTMDIQRFSYQQNTAKNNADSSRHLPLSQQGKWPPQYKNKFELTHSIGMIETPLSCKGPNLENQRIQWHQQPEANGKIITTPQSNYTQLSTSVRQSTAPKRDDDNMSRFGGGMSKMFSEKGGNSSQLNCSQEIGVKLIMDGSEEEIQDLVMSRSDWFQCLKVAYSQLEQKSNEEIQERHINNQKPSDKSIGVDKEQLISMIQINLNQLPLQSLKEYIGQSVVRKEKWISLANVMESIKKIETQPSSVKKGKTYQEEQENVIFWDDIIDSLLVVTLNNNRSSLAIDSNNISEIYSSEAAFSIGAAVNNKNNNLQQLENYAHIHQINNDIGKAVMHEQAQMYQAQQQQKQAQSKQVNSFKQEILKQGKKLVLKDGSILLDLSRVEDSHNSKSVQEIIQLFVAKDQQHNLRGMSLACLSLTMFASQYLNISNMNGLVILNLSAMININLEQELSRVNLLNLQFLNISNNQLQQINFSNHNFPKLKEIYANNNRFITAKSFAKLDSIKLLDLEDNQIEDYDELVCLAFLQNMMVLSLKGNPISGFLDFDINMKKILSKVTLLNPECIKKVSCFENFKELAFGNGVKPLANNSDSQHSQYHDVPKRTVNINIDIVKSQENLIHKYNVGAPIQIGQTTTVSQQSTPNKQSQYNVHTKRYFLKKDDSPVTEQCVNNNKSPSKVALSQKVVHQQQYHQNDIYESVNVQNKVECPQALPIKNDSLKYFNKLSRKGDAENNNRQSKEGISTYSMSMETETDRDMKLQNQSQINKQNISNQNINASQSTLDKRDDLSSSKPPRCIKIRPSPTIQTNSSQSQIIHPRAVSVFEQSNRGMQNSAQTLIMDSSSVTETEAAGLPTPKYNRREVQSQQIQPFLPFQNVQNDQYQDFSRKAHGQQAQNEIQLQCNNQYNNDVARYYERSISQMNINKIREMASKEVCKVSDQQIKGNMSPINAMMILQPPTDQKKAQQQQEQHDNRNSLTNKGERNVSQQTPKQSKQSQNSHSKSNSTVRRRNDQSNKSKKVTPKSQSGFIKNDNSSFIGQTSNQNKTQTFSFNKIGNQDQRISNQGHPPRSKSKSSLLKNSSRNKKLNPNGLSMDKNHTQGASCEVIPYQNGGGYSRRSSMEGQESNMLRGNKQYNGSRFEEGNKTQHPITNREGQFATPFQNYINNIADLTSKESERDSIRPFRLPPRESPSLYKKHSQIIGKENDLNKSDYSQSKNTNQSQQNFVDRRHSNVVLMPQQYDNGSQEDRINQLKTTEKKKDHTYSNNNSHYDNQRRQHQNYYLNDPNDGDYDQYPDDHINTPRFSDRNKDSNKEHKYQAAMKKITSKRQKQEDKKQLYNSIKGNH